MMKRTISFLAVLVLLAFAAMVGAQATEEATEEPTVFFMVPVTEEATEAVTEYATEAVTEEAFVQFSTPAPFPDPEPEQEFERFESQPFPTREPLTGDFIAGEDWVLRLEDSNDLNTTIIVGSLLFSFVWSLGVLVWAVYRKEVPADEAARRGDAVVLSYKDAMQANRDVMAMLERSYQHSTQAQKDIAEAMVKGLTAVNAIAPERVKADDAVKALLLDIMEPGAPNEFGVIPAEKVREAQESQDAAPRSPDAP